MNRCPAHLRSRGFTLIEAALTTVIVGVGVLAVAQLFSACSRQNSTSTDYTVAQMLAGNIQETMAGLGLYDPVTTTSNFGPELGETLATYNDVDDFDGASLNPPIDSLRSTIADLAQYTQVVTVVPVYPMQPNSNTNEQNLEIPKTTFTGAVRVNVRVLRQINPSDPAYEVYRTSWIRVDD